MKPEPDQSQMKHHEKDILRSIWQSF